MPPAITVLNPTAPPRELRRAMAARLPDLRGQTIGFLWNTKPNGDILFARIEDLLHHKYEIAAIHRLKATSSIPAPDSVVNELSSAAQAAVVGLGD